MHEEYQARLRDAVAMTRDLLGDNTDETSVRVAAEVISGETGVHPDGNPEPGEGRLVATVEKDMTKIPEGMEARVICHSDHSRSTILTDITRPLREQLTDHGVGFSETEMGWIDDGHGAENDNWLVRIVDPGEPFEDGERRPCIEECR